MRLAGSGTSWRGEAALREHASPPRPTLGSQRLPWSWRATSTAIPHGGIRLGPNGAGKTTPTTLSRYCGLTLARSLAVPRSPRSADARAAAGGTFQINSLFAADRLRP
jgi:hypothetical protein